MKRQMAEFTRVAAFFSRPKHATISDRFTSGEVPYISPISPLHLPYISPTSPLYLPYISTCAASDEMAAMPPMERPRKTWSGPGPGLGLGPGPGLGLGLGLEGRRQTIAK